MTSDAEIDGSVLSDPELIISARLGDSQSFGTLYERHAGAAWAVARQYTNSAADAEDVVSEAFTRLYTILQEGGGPDTAFRAYLFTVIRRLGMARVEGVRRDTPTDDDQMFEQAAGSAAGPDEPVLEGFERGVVGEAYRSLPERWQAVLWYTEVERLPSAQIAPLLGLSANGVAALAYRAREGLRQAYLQQHLAQPLDDGCREVAGKLGAYVRGGLAKRETAQVDEHLETCARCRALLLELGDVNHGMRGIIAPLVLGLLGTGALAHQLPVGGGTAAGWAALGEHGLAGATAGSGTGSGAAGSGGTSTGASGGAAGGGAGASGAGAAGAAAGAAAAGGGIFAGITGLLGALPVAAAVVGAGLLVAATLGVAGLLGVFTNDDADVITRPGGTVAIEQELGVDPPAAEAPAVPPVVVSPPEGRGGWYDGGRRGDDDSAVPPEADAVPEVPVPEVPAETGPTVDPGTETDGRPGTGTDPDDGPDPDAGPNPGGDPGPDEPAPVLQPGDVTATAVETSVDVDLQGNGRFSVNVANTGSVAATDLTLQVAAPAGVLVQLSGEPDPARAEMAPATDDVSTVAAAAEAVGWQCDAVAQGADCRLSGLGEKSSVTATFDLVVPDGVVLSPTDAVTVTLHGGGVIDGAVALPIRTAGEVVAAPLPAPWTVVVGSPSRVVLDLVNQGTIPVLATEVGVDLVLPPGLSLAQVSAGSPWQCAASESSDAGTPVSCRPVADMAGGEARPLELDLLASSALLRAGEVTLEAQVSTAATTTATVAVPVTVLGAQLEVVGTPSFEPSESPIYRDLVVTVRNSGAATASGASIGTVFEEGRWGGGPGTDLGSLAPGDSITVRLPVLVLWVVVIDDGTASVDITLSTETQRSDVVSSHTVAVPDDLIPLDLLGQAMDAEDGVASDDAGTTAP